MRALFPVLLLLVLPGATHAEEAERPSWLRPLADPESSTIEPSGESGEEDSKEGWAGWSKLEPRVLDVQAWDWLQMDLERMLDLTTAPPPNHLSPKAFEAKYLDATVDFLEIDAAVTRTFQIAVHKALDELEGARGKMLRQRAEMEPDLDENAAMLRSRASWKEYREAQSQATRYPLALLQELPRHQLLRETMLKWLLRLDYGMEAAAK